MSQFTTADVASHNNADKGLYIIIDSNVYDVTNFIDEHPGGAKILKRVAGKDASKQFWKVSFPPIIWTAGLCGVVLCRHRCLIADGVLTTSFRQYHNENVLKKYSPKLKIGEVKEAAKL